jgi:hypothetical protein
MIHMQMGEKNIQSSPFVMLIEVNPENAGACVQNKSLLSGNELHTRGIPSIGLVVGRGSGIRTPGTV